MPTRSTAGPARTTSTAGAGATELLGGAPWTWCGPATGERDVIDCGQSTDFAIVDRDGPREALRAQRAPGGGARRWGGMWW